MDQIIPPTVGHHFGDILICKQKAWLHYHGNSREKMRPPVYLRVMQVEGHQLESEIYKSRYEGAYKIPGIGTKSQIRVEKTKEAMQRGEPIILQGYVETPFGNGTIDVMEKVGEDSTSRVGFSYRVGEIKRSEKLMTAHIMQVAWYTELLEQAYGQKVTDVFFILGSKDNHIHTENLENYYSDYESLKKALFELRDAHIPPGEHLIPACASCDWRGVCMPNLVRKDHLSLLPVLTPNQVISLEALGLKTWQSVEEASDETLLEIGLSPFEIGLIRKGLENLKNGLTPMRNQFRKDLFDGAVSVSLDFQEFTSSREGGSPSLPNSVYWYKGNELYKAEIQYGINGTIDVDIDDLLAEKKLVFYGGTDIGAFAKILKSKPGIHLPELFDVFDFIEQNVHIPIPGLELRNLLQHISKVETSQTGPQRAWAVQQVVHWLSASL